MSSTKKLYKQYPNEIRTLQERRLLYCYLRQIGLNRNQARIFYSWSTPHICWALKQLSTKEVIKR